MGKKDRVNGWKAVYGNTWWCESLKSKKIAEISKDGISQNCFAAYGDEKSRVANPCNMRLTR